MNTMLKRWNIRILIGVLLSGAALAQSTGGDPSPKQASVSVPLFINDRKDHPVADIKQSELVVLDKKQTLRSVLSLKRGNELPLRLGLLFDVSNSGRASRLYQPALKAASDLLNQLLVGPEDRVFIEPFSATPEKATEFMSKAQLLSHTIDLRFGGGTAMYDAVDFACKSRMETDTGQPVRRVLILLSDGGDNLSHITQGEAIAAAMEAGTVIFAVSTQDYSSNGSDNTKLMHLAEKTGGEAFLHLGPGDIEKALSRIREQIENMYTITFDPPEPDQKGFHSIELKLSGNDKVRVSAPKGYYLK